MQLWNELFEVLFNAGWRATQSNTRTIFPPGISVLVGTNGGPAFNCGQRLKDLLDALGVHPASLHASETNSDLIGCNNECVNVVLERPAFGSTHIRRF